VVTVVCFGSRTWLFTEPISSVVIVFTRRTKPSTCWTRVQTLLRRSATPQARGPPASRESKFTRYVLWDCTSGPPRFEDLEETRSYHTAFFSVSSPPRAEYLPRSRSLALSSLHYKIRINQSNGKPSHWWPVAQLNLGRGVAYCSQFLFWGDFWRSWGYGGVPSRFRYVRSRRVSQSSSAHCFSWWGGVVKVSLYPTSDYLMTHRTTVDTVTPFLWFAQMT
jgi:hypothetical protein